MRRQAGFTLIEVMIATTIAVLVLGSVYAVFAGVTRAWTTVEARSATDQRARVVCDRIGRELRGAWRPQEGSPFFVLARDRDGSPVLSFATAATTLAATGRGGMAAVRYALGPAQDDAAGRTLQRTEEPYYRRDLLGELAGYTLCDRVREVRWRLYDGEAWREEWDAAASGRWPQLAELTLILLQGGEEVALRAIFDLPRLEPR